MPPKKSCPETCNLNPADLEDVNVGPSTSRGRQQMPRLFFEGLSKEALVTWMVTNMDPNDIMKCISNTGLSKEDAQRAKGIVQPASDDEIETFVNKLPTEKKALDALKELGELLRMDYIPYSKAQTVKKYFPSPWIKSVELIKFSRDDFEYIYAHEMVSSVNEDGTMRVYKKVEIVSKANVLEGSDLVKLMRMMQKVVTKNLFGKTKMSFRTIEKDLIFLGGKVSKKKSMSTSFGKRKKSKYLKNYKSRSSKKCANGVCTFDFKKKTSKKNFKKKTSKRS